MGVIYLVRHGQAAFGTAHYDRLTDRGRTQAQLLGVWLAARGVRFDAVFTGTLQRQIDTAHGICEARADFSAGPVHERFVALNEYDPEALLRAHGGPVPQPDEAAVRRDPEAVRAHFRRLRDALVAWADARIEPQGMPAFADFQQGAVAALVDARQRFPEGHVLVVSSGGPIAACVCAALGAPPAMAVELNLRIRNASLTEFASSARRHHLLSFNGVPHLESQADPALITYA